MNLEFRSDPETRTQQEQVPPLLRSAVAHETPPKTVVRQRRRRQTRSARAARLIGGSYAGAGLFLFLLHLFAAPPVLNGLPATGWYLLLGTLAGLFAAARARRLAWASAGLCAATLLGLIVARGMAPVYEQAFRLLPGEGMDDLLSLTLPLTAGALVWARRTRPLKAALWTGAGYAAATLVLASAGNDPAVWADNGAALKTWLVLHSAEGALVGGLLGATRRWGERAMGRSRRAARRAQLAQERRTG